MRLVNRYILILRPTPALIEWLGEKTPVLGSPTLHEVLEDSQTFLLDCFEDRRGAEAWVESQWRFFFEQQLLEWVPNRSRWPKKLTRVLFNTWFTPEIHEMVWDLGTTVLFHDTKSDFAN